MLECSNAEYQINEWFNNAPEKIEFVKNTKRDSYSMAKLHLHDGSYLGEIVGNYSKITLCAGYFSLLCGMGENSIVDINVLNKPGMPELFPRALIIAYDMNGNIFALNSGACKEAGIGRVLYLPKEGFAWEDLDLSYAQFLKWLSGLTENELIINGWKPDAEYKSISNIAEYLMGKAAAYNMFLRQRG